MSEELVALLFLLGAPVVLGVLFRLIGRLEDGTAGDPGRTPFDPPPRGEPGLRSHQR